MKSISLLLGAAALLGIVSTAQALDRISLDGQWRFALDRDDVGVGQKWYETNLSGQIRLPGALQEQGFGDPPSAQTKWISGIGVKLLSQPKYAAFQKSDDFKTPFWLTPARHYVGAAWYQRDIEVPREWAQKRVTVSLQRPHGQTTCWIDGTLIGSQDSLGVPHTYDITIPATPGGHRLTICQDNRLTIPVGKDAHSVSDQTQTDWNGIVGSIILSATDRTWINDLQVYPDIAAKKIKVSIEIGNLLNQAGQGKLIVHAESRNTADKHIVAAKQFPITWNGASSRTEIEYELGAEAQLWDEFSPALYDLTIELAGADGKTIDSRPITFGLREVKVAGHQFTMNGRPIFLRGTLECCIFPLTGYPPTDVESWKHILRIARAHGLNHLRFHSWCPPEAAFVAADEMGFYYQVECSCWAEFGSGTPVDRWIYDEAARMLQAYANHPSFILMAASNEPAGKNRDAFLNQWVEHFKAADSRLKYTAGSGWPHVPANDYHVQQEEQRLHQTAELRRPPQTTSDYRSVIEKAPVPLVTHEMGQWCVYPNFDEIPKYTGWLRAGNLEIFKAFLEKSGMLSQAKDFLMASGKFQALLYKAEIEEQLRTPGMAGFQLLDLHDFPGQGTAPVGVLDAFWDSKGYITAEQYRRFCNQTVPLARLSRRVYTTEQSCNIPIEIAHFGPIDLHDVVAGWRVRDTGGPEVAKGELHAPSVKTGGNTSLGAIQVPLTGFTSASKLNLEVSINGTEFVNDWDFWVYPARTDPSIPDGISVETDFDKRAIESLNSGGKVLLALNPRRIQGDTVGAFQPIFWNRITFINQPQHTLGVLCDPKHPAFAEFPTDAHSDWEWWDIQERSKPMIFDAMPQELKPLVQVIDDWNLCRRLGLAFEARVGKGKLLMCSIDLVNDLELRPAARQLKRSLLDYMAGDSFSPSVELSAQQIQAMLQPLSDMQKLGARVASVDSEEPSCEAVNVLDGNPKTMWHTAWSGAVSGLPHELVIELHSPAAIRGCKLLPRQDGNRNGLIQQCAVYSSEDGQTWDLQATGDFEPTSKAKELIFDHDVTTRFVKLSVSKVFSDQPYASLAEFTLIAGGK